MRLVTAMLLVLASAGAGATEVYRWTDKDGNVHYGDRPKQGGQVVDIQPASGPGSEDAEAAKAAQARAAECDRLRSQYDVYSKATSLRETDSLGRTKEFTPEERQAFLERVQKQRDEACASVAAAAPVTETP